MTGSADLPSILAAASGGLTVKHAAALLYLKKETKVTRPEVEKARRKLDKLVDDGAATMKKADMRTAEVTYYPS